jgi:hypothetical protein
MVSLLIFLLYHTFLVTPIMGYHQRFLYPVWPILVYSHLQKLDRLDALAWRSANSAANRDLRHFGCTLLAGWRPSLGCIRPANVRATFGKMDLNTAYRELGQNNWPYLPEFLYLGDSLKIASTELGILGAMAPRNNIYDLSGLHHLETARYGLDTDHLLRQHHPDLIYMPHPDYVEMIAAIRRDTSFQRYYLEYPSDSIQSWLGIALWKESPFFLQMQHIVTLGKNVDAEIVP